jgi:Na+-driven multidrug efflux pump
MVSNIIGQGKQEEVLPLIRKIVKISVGSSLIIFLLLNIYPEVFISFFGQGQEFITEAVPVVRIVSLAMIMMAFSVIWLNAVTGSGNTVVNLTIELITITLYSIYVFVVLEYLNLPITWGWASEGVYWMSMFTMAYLYMRSGRWKEKKI